MQQESSKQYDFKNFNDHAGGHKMSGFIKDLAGVGKYERQIDTQVNHKEQYKKQSGQRHDQLFSNG